MSVRTKGRVRFLRKEWAQREIHRFIDAHMDGAPTWKLAAMWDITESQVAHLAQRIRRAGYHLPHRPWSERSKEHTRHTVERAEFAITGPDGITQVDGGDLEVLEGRREALEAAGYTIRRVA